MHVVGKLRHIFSCYNSCRISKGSEIQKILPRLQLQSTNFSTRRSDKALNEATELASNEKYTTGAYEKIKCHLQDIYSASEEQCFALLGSIESRQINDEIFIPVIDILREEDVPLDQLIRNPWILQYGKKKLLPRLSHLQSGDHMFTAASHCLSFCSHSMAYIKKYWAFLKHEKSQLPSQYPNKVYYMADKLRIDVPVLSESMARSKHVLLAPFSRVREIVDLYIYYNVPEENILRDPYVFCYCVESSKKRMDIMYGLHKAVDKRKLWITRCTEKQFNSSLRLYMETQEEEKLLAPYDGSLARYIAQKLGLRLELVENRMQTHFTYSPKPSKVSNVIDLLLSEGFTPEQILGTLSVLQYSLKRMRKRVEVLRELGVRRYSIRRLFCPQTQFELFCVAETCRRRAKFAGTEAVQGERQAKSYHSEPRDGDARDFSGVSSLDEIKSRNRGFESFSLDGVRGLKSRNISLEDHNTQPLSADGVRTFHTDLNRLRDGNSFTGGNMKSSENNLEILCDNKLKSLNNGGTNITNNNVNYGECIKSQDSSNEQLNDGSVAPLAQDCVSSCNGR